MPPRKRTTDEGDEPVAKRRSSRQAAAASIKKADVKDQVSVDKARKGAPSRTKDKIATSEKDESKGDGVKKTKKATAAADDKKTPAKKGRQPKAKKEDEDEAQGEAKPSPKGEKAKDDTKSSRAVSEDIDIDSIPTTNPDAPRHDGEWYWLMKAEPESRFENGIDVRFSIDDLRAREKPEGWDGEFL